MSMSMRDTVHSSISRSNRNTAILSIIAILVALAGFIGVGGKSFTFPDSDITFTPTSKFILGNFGTPRALTEEDLVSIPRADLPIFNATVKGEEMLDNGDYEETTTTRNGVSTGTSITAYFGLLLFENHALLVRTPATVDEDINEYTGVLTANHEVGDQIYDAYLADDPEAADILLPWTFDTGYDAMPWYLGAGAEAILLLGGLFGLATVASRRNHDNHPVMKRVARFGDVESVMSQIDGEMASGQIAQVDKLQITRNWIIYKAGNDMHFARIGDIMWAYKHVTQTRYGKNYAAYIWDRSGNMLNIGSNEKNVDAMIMAVLQRAPWAIAGYNKDVEKSWKNDRAGFIRTVDDRRKQMTTQQ